jgi:putative transposase
MTNYRRNFICGGSFFFTANLAERRLRLLVDYIDLLRQAFRYVRRRHPFDIEAIVVLPDHLHAIWTLPEGDADFALRWRLIKSMFSRGLPAGERRSASRAEKGERGIWQRRYWEHTLRDEEDFARHADYIHFNPVKHGYVSRVPDWPYSSFHRMVRFGVYPLDWAGDAADARAEPDPGIYDCSERIAGSSAASGSSTAEPTH